MQIFKKSCDFFSMALVPGSVAACCSIMLFISACEWQRPDPLPAGSSSGRANAEAVARAQDYRNSDTRLSYKQVLGLISNTDLTSLELEAADAFYLAAPLRNTSHSTCGCALYRQAVSTELSRSSIRSLSRNNEEYTRIMLLLRRSVEDCADQRSLILQALLASIQGHGHTTLSLTTGQEPTAEVLLANAISSWYRHDYDAAYQLFFEARESNHEYDAFLEEDSSFSSEYKTAQLLDRARKQSIETKIDIQWVEATLREAINRRSDALRDLLLPSLTDFAFSSVENIDRPKLISQGAKFTKDLLFVLDLIEALEAHEEVYKLSSRRDQLFTQQKEARAILGRLHQLPGRKERLSIDELSDLVKLVLLRGGLSMEYFDAICTSS